MRTPKCHCARCMLYVRATIAEDPEYDIFEEDGVTKKITKFETREYQTSLIEIAKRRNIIACLPTGSGKTYIAFKLVEHFQDDIISTGKKVIFLANTIPLVTQQAEFFARNSLLKVKHLTGDMEVDYWGDEKWGKVVDGFQILAMTTQIFVNIIQHAYIKFSQVVLIIFDECHHAVHNHPMKLVMQKYHETKRMEPSYLLPRVLGLTATIIKGNCKESEVPDRVDELERTMHAKAITYKDYETVLKHSTSSRIEKYRVYADLTSYLDSMYCLDQLQLFSKELNVLRNERKKFKATTTIKGIDPTLHNTDNLYLSLRKPSPGDLRIAVDDAKYCCTNLGPYCGIIAINLKLAFIEFSLLDLNDGIMKDWYQKVRNLFLRIKTNLENWMGARSDKEKVLLTSTKLRQLVDIVKIQFGRSDANPCLFDDETGVCGLVFVDRRVTAQVMAWYLKDLASLNPDYEFIRANFVVGTSRAAFESADSVKIYSKKQRETIEGFRTKKYNLLIATSVLEEGIDVPSCNLIVRYDKIGTYTSYIQSMGRARKPNALFCALIDNLNYPDENTQLDTFRRINEAMVRHLISNVEKVDEHVQPMVLDHNVEPFCPGGTADSPSVTLESAMDVVDGYCNLLPCDGIATLQTLSWWTESNGMYRGHLKFPMNALIRETVIGEWMSSKGLARQGVHFAAAKKLYELGVLDDTLLPVRPPMPDKVEAFFKGLTSKAVPDEEEDGELPEGRTEKNKEGTDSDAGNTFGFNATWYPKRLPKIFIDAQPPARNPHSCKVYRICLDLTEPTPNENYPFRNLYNFQKGLGFALVTSLDIPDVGSFPLYGGFGIITASLQLLPNFRLKDIPFNFAPDFQGFIFDKIFNLANRVLEPNRDGPFFILPIIEDRSRRMSGEASSWNVDEALLKDIVAFTGVQRLKRPHEDVRRQRAPKSMDQYKQKFTDGVVTPWYKKGSPLIYCVETIEEGMTPTSPFHDTNFSSYKAFIETEYKTQIYDVNQPLLKTKLAGVGKGSKQLNYLLEKYAKEDEDPVRLVPELVHQLPISASSMVQLKLIPSFLHRLNRLLIAREILVDISERCDWKGILSSATNTARNEDDMNRLTAEQDEKRVADKKRREEFQERLRKAHKQIPEKQHIENRDLHYEFIHPNKITMKDIKLFHEAVSDQHAAKKLIASIDLTMQADGVDNDYKIELTALEDINLMTLEPEMAFESEGGPSPLAIMEALTVFKSNDGVSNMRLHKIGWSFLNYIISRELFMNYPSDWSEPLMCQMRNRILSIHYLVGIAKRRNLAEFLSASDFYPAETWLPPGFKVISANGDIGAVAAHHKVPLKVYDPVEIPVLKAMTPDALDNYVRVNAPKFVRVRPLLGAGDPLPVVGDPSKGKSKRVVKPTPPLTGGIYSSYTHTEIADHEIAQALCALVGAFFIKCGMTGALKVLDWLEFRIPDINGEEQRISKSPIPAKFSEAESRHLIPEVNRLLPHASKLETKLGYTFVNRKLLLEALTHPTYLANNVSECYQRMEFLGDAILDAVLTNHVFALTTKKDRPDNAKYTTLELTEVRGSLVNNITYASLAVRYGLHKQLLSMSKALLDMIDNFVVYQEASSHEVLGHFTLISDEEVWGPKHFEVPKVLGDIFEALAGAIYIDSGGSLDTVWKVFYRLMEREIDGFSTAIPKSPIQELYAEFPAQVKFTKWTSQKLRARGRDAMKITVGPHAHGAYFGAGTNITRARDAAAKVALKMIKEEDLFIKDRDASKIMMLC